MPSLPLPVAAALLLALAPGPAPAEREPYQLAQLTLVQRVVVRVPRLPAAQTARVAPKPVVWVEKKGPKCIALDQLAGALVLQPGSVDLVLAGGARVRAQLDDECPALDFYSGFYLRPTPDGKICADRDAVRSRAGRSCQIDKFRTLVAKR